MSIMVPPLGRRNPVHDLLSDPPPEYPFHPFGRDGSARNTWPHFRATTAGLDAWVRKNRAALHKATAGFSPQDAELYRRLSYIAENDENPKVRSTARELRGQLADGIKAVQALPDVPYVIELERLKMSLDGVRRHANRYTGTYFQPAPRQ